MRAILVVAGAWAVWAGAGAGAVAGAEAERGRFGFYRSMREPARGAGAGGERRVFGGRAAPADAWGAACALLDRFWAARCSGAVLAPRWALTAAHCVSSHLAYVKYNSHRPSSKEGSAAPVHYVYRHPGFRAEERAGDVRLLHHDVGLVRTRADMALARAPPRPPLAALALYDAADLAGHTVDVLGFGRSEAGGAGERLLVARLVVAPCGRADWLHVACGRAGPGAAAAGACAGDSGGPVVYRGAQVGVTSMGPLECAAGGAGPVASVFTALHRYAPLINSTIHESDAALRMVRLPPAAGGPAPRPRLLLVLCPLYTYAMLGCGYSLVYVEAAAAASIL